MVPSDDVKMGLETNKLVDGRTVMAGGGGGSISSDVNAYLYVVSRGSWPTWRSPHSYVTYPEYCC